MRKEKKSPLVQAWIQQTAAPDLTTTVITIAEIQCGIERQTTSDPSYAAETQRWVDALLEVGGMHVIPLGIRAALSLAKMHETASLRNVLASNPRQRRTKTPADLAIALIAIAEGAMIATGVGHFEQINQSFPLPGVYNPFRGEWIVQPAPA